MSHSQELSNWLKNLPNKLTLARIAVIPLILLIYPFGIEFLQITAALLFALAALTDFFDGYIARRYNSVSSLGALLDPIADKLLVTAALVLLTNAQVLPAILTALLLCREVGISGLRLAALEQKLEIKVNFYGKLKTAAQDVGIFCLMIQRPDLHNIGMIAIWIALGLSYFSAYQYWDVFWKTSKSHFS